MGRRALKKVDPDIDLSSYLLSVDELPRPWQAEKVFSKPAPLEVEVGSGKGLFLAAAGQSYPDKNFLGIEIAKKYARFSAFRLSQQKLPNAVVATGDALVVFREVLPDKSVHAVHVYFPDPWWKARHRKRRIMNASFLHDVQRVLIPAGELHFWTDVHEYYEQALEVISRESTLEGPLPVPKHEPQHDFDFRTHFERRMRMHDKPIYRAVFHSPEARPVSPQSPGRV